MENYIVSARKYRPVTFDTVVGQGPITRTLKNSIHTQRLAHAYLFCGPRGVGKTTCARIFAKTINCENITADAEACNKCESCRSFNESRSFNIHELDAASNNSVDDIRNLIDQIRIPPQIGRYSIYIIDEVHMLSASAFNSFLKTLEEPPRHAIFILATTEKHKIIPTILSRCQIFDFNRIKVDQIVKYLQEIADKENIASEPDALNIIALKADGAMRDALTIFDQIVSFAGKQVTYKQVIENLNVLDYDYYFRLTELFLRSDYTKALLLFNEILDRGFDPHNFIIGLAGHFRDLLICRSETTLGLLEVGAGIRDKYRQQVKDCPAEFLFQALQICTNSDLNFRLSRNQRLHVELTLVQLTRLAGMPWETGQKRGSHHPAASGADSSDEKKNLTPEKEEIFVEKKKNSTESTLQAGNLNMPGGPQSTASREPLTSVPSTYSIKDALKEKTAKRKPEIPAAPPASAVEEISPGYEPENALTEELMREKFREFINSIRTGKPRMYNALKDQEPSLGKQLEVIFRMNNTSQQDVFNKEIRIDLLKYLRRELHNPLIQIVTEVQPSENDKSLLYTAKERFNYLSKKNPELIKFKQQMNLDFD